MRAAAAAILACLFAAGPAAAAPRILVMPFENVNRSGRIFWLTEAAAVIVTDDLNALGADAITRDERREAFERLQVPPVAVLTDATAIRIGELVGATEIVIGSIELSGDDLVVRARSITLDTGRVEATSVERGPLPDLFATFERVSRHLGPPSMKTTEEVERTHPPLPAFENYVKGLLADSPATATNYLNAALKEQPSFGPARLALWDVYNDEGEHQKALASVEPVPPDSPIARPARFRAGLSQLALKRYDDAFGTFKALADANPTAPVLNDIGVVQLRRGATSQTGQATYYFTKASQADTADPDYFFNLGYAYWQEHDTQAAIYWLREAVRRNPADGDAHAVLGAALAVAGNTAESSRENELARRLSSSYQQWQKRPPADSVPKGLERLKSFGELPHARSVDATVATSEQKDQQELARFYLDRGRRLFEQERNSEALVELNRALYLSPYAAEAHLLVGRIHLRAGEVRDAIDAFKISLWSNETAAAHVALGEAYLANKQPADARAEAQRALTLDPASSDAKSLLAKTQG